MRTKKLLLPLLALLLVCTACNKVDGKLSELEQKPMAADAKSAKVLYVEARNFRRWIEKNESPSKQQLERANALETKRRNEMVEITGEGILDGIKNTIGGLLGGSPSGDGKSPPIDLDKVKKKVGDAVNKVLGADSVEKKKFGCPDNVDITKEGASRLCP